MEHYESNTRQFRQIKNVTAPVFAAEIRRGINSNRPLYLFSITIADINKALEKLNSLAVKKSMEEIKNQLPPMLQHLSKIFQADED